MYRIKDFEQIITSELSDDEVVNKIMSIILEDKSTSSYNHQKMGYFCGFITEDDLIPMTSGFVGDACIKLDEKDIYLTLISEIRTRLKKGERYEFAAIKSIQQLVQNYFYKYENTEARLAKFNKYLAFFQKRCELIHGTCEGHYAECLDAARERYIFAEDIDTDQFTTIYPLTAAKGLGDGALCVERNALTNNLLIFAGFPCININSPIIFNGNQAGHNFNVFQLLENGPFMIFDTSLYVYLEAIPTEYTLEDGFSLSTKCSGNQISYMANNIKISNPYIKKRKNENNN